MNRIISPPKSDWDKLHQPLEVGERQFIEYLDDNLHMNWEIYIQPHLNGLCPDVVILNPNIGIGVFEVKNWNFKAMNYFLQEDKYGRTQLQAINNSGVTFQYCPNPVDKLLQYKKEVVDLYSFGLNFQKHGSLAVNVGLVLPSATKEEAEELLLPIFKSRNKKVFNLVDEGAENYNHCIITQENLSEDIKFVLPTGITRFSSKFMDKVIANQLRIWLIEPESNREQRTPINYNTKQLDYVNSRTKSGYRRIKGSAGSGKSVVLVGRAVKLMEARKKVLVVNFNITMLNYLQDLAVRINPQARRKITWLNFHNLGSRLCGDAGLNQEMAKLFEESTGFPDNDQYCLLVNEAINRFSNDYKDHKYDAILVDEGQDFSLEWWNILRRLLNDNGEMLLVADSTQDIYEQATLWTDESMQGAGFRGEWVGLEGTYRLPNEIIPLVVNFSDTFLPKEMVNTPIKIQMEISFNKTYLGWEQVNSLSSDIIENIILSIKNFLIDKQELSMNDISILVQDKSLGKDVCGVLDKIGIRHINIFSFDKDSETSIKEERARKMAFYKGDTRIKVCTIHSFKGWESKAILLFINKAEELHDYSLIYTGLTRLKSTDSSLMKVVCSTPNLANYSKIWPNDF
ncbi:UvrD-helicase domain-containing protein [Psychrobacter piscatorii]|uniref:UvrD-helicase domain-containing protein n=1 Tax=Psychrobacter piscatorii TaxID=554343 RepID=UPI00191B15D5|nr:UvrD-helicase domain-containing protein [Psychrobacter piscatorii]